MASSLRLASPAELAGAWHLYPAGGERQPCAIALVEAGETLAGDLACAGRLLGGAPATWFPTPDGIALVDSNGDTLLHMGRQREGFYMATLPNSQVLYLQRATTPDPTRF
ncbi:protease inhibitor Inh/omp19 family protein [Pseudomonas sp. RIT-PI-S]|uniref:protease inhibitor Inh/omp19 family protein n=1 Tax=Pseudomonas sp. RIT-PI-S TaxID=3035295 RepID=UPI0021DA686D|nr:protease inhibitor Inh/omp19 family protein [Pseudomonas sp. RIT-PI-S]